jgi:hypothetical protein
MTGWSGGPVYEQRARMEYDALGRTVKTYDGLNRATGTVEFVPPLAVLLPRLRRQMPLAM